MRDNLHRYILLALITVILLSCGELKERYKESDEIWDNISVFQYRGHQYIKFEDNKWNMCGVAHDPDCPCQEY